MRTTVIKVALIAGTSCLMVACHNEPATTAKNPQTALALVKGDDKVLAECGPQEGHAYYPAAGLVSENDSGWVSDKVTDGGTTLVRRADGRLDLRFADASKKVYSALGDGGTVTIHRSGPNEIVAVIAYPANTIEIYQFVRAANGELVMMELQSKGGDGPLYKAGVLKASCSFVDFG
jgi:hypothetical protein